MRAEARAEPVDQMGQFGLVLRAIQSRLQGIEPRGGKRGEPHDIESETGIAFVGQHREAIDEQPLHPCGIAQGLARADLDPLHLAVGAEQRDLEAPCALAMTLHAAHQFLGKMRDRAKDILLARDRVGEAAFDDVRRQRQTRHDGFLIASECLIEPLDQRGAESRGERCARQIGNVAHLFQSAFVQGADDFRREAQRGERKRQQQVAEIVIRRERF